MADTPATHVVVKWATRLPNGYVRSYGTNEAHARKVVADNPGDVLVTRTLTWTDWAEEAVTDDQHP